MPRTKEQLEEIRQVTRSKIQSAAMHLFVQKGFGSTNVQEIADQAGISIGLLYRHYKSKEVLFNELVEYAQVGMERVTERFESDESPKQLIEQFADEIYNDMISGEELANLMILMAQSFFSRGEAKENQRDVARINSKLLSEMSKLIRRGQQLGEFGSGDASEMAIYFFSAVQGLAEMKIVLRDSFTMPSPSILTAFLYKKGE
ncbi:transcriptional regulator, TetR family [Paenibacillus sp. UNCCL117]|uniref:TetR/AcrR family transcriptional regulator n=1 Tax=unclassified Paenibacillus TaxID=185978 RepID=UPI0008887F1A|nr:MULTISPECIES: TetR/AcrR family transcriptional regulator [unclassified Paenibacillus]SDC13677.1 DNA-binding transcriptional regulator, AcrR family [Paenibacillus sp. cl123]SFW17127.1 transcriptional regulator, TetR family [Paenibacillus sp. UNCCL117]